MNDLISKCNNLLRYPAIAILSANVLIFKCSPPPKESESYTVETTVLEVDNTIAWEGEQRKSKLGGAVPYISQAPEDTYTYSTGTTLTANLSESNIKVDTDLGESRASNSYRTKVQHRITKLALSRMLESKQYARYRSLWLGRKSSKVYIISKR